MKQTYSNSPGFKVRGTSEAAAHAMKPKAKTLRERVLAKLKRRARTADEIAYELEASVLAVRPRFSELLAKRKIRDAGKRRKNESGKWAIVWRVT